MAGLGEVRKGGRTPLWYTSNKVSTIKSQGFRKKRASAPDFLKLIQILREMTSGPE
jgi:hypothetical protein